MPSPLPLPLGMFSCAHVRANYFSISRVFDCSRQSSSSSSSSSVDRPSKHDTFRSLGRGRRYHNLCPHLGREKSGSIEESPARARGGGGDCTGDPRTCDQPPPYIVPRLCAVGFVGSWVATRRATGHNSSSDRPNPTIRRDPNEDEEKRGRGAKKKWTANQFE